MGKYDVVLVTSRAYVDAVAGRDMLVDQVVLEDSLAFAELEKLGCKVARVSWDNPLFDWSSTKLAVIRTTWDYFDRFPEFSSWFEATALVTTLVNDANVLRWNMNKLYLRDLADAGIPIPPTRFLAIGSMASLVDEVTASGWTECILKPLVSGGARHTYRISPTGIAHEPEGPLPGHAVTADSLDCLYRKLIAVEGFMLQPFIKSVEVEGEVSYMVFGGTYTHAVGKRAKSGDFRVQDDWGGSVHDYVATPEEVAFAERVVATAQRVTGRAILYARVDVVKGDDGGPLLIELEVVEPELWFRNSPLAVQRYAEALKAHLATVATVEE